MKAFVKSGTSLEPLLDLLKKVDDSTHLKDVPDRSEEIQITIQPENKQTHWIAETNVKNETPTYKTQVRWGRSLERLIELLQKQDRVIRDATALGPHESWQLSVHTENQDLVWKLNSVKAMPRPYNRKWWGTNLTGLYEKLGELYPSQNVNECIDVLAMTTMDVTKTNSGKYLTQWAKISPGVPYELDAKSGAPVFDVMDLTLTNRELSICSESGLAFYDEKEDIVYPIRECAFQSIGKLMDCAASFKYKHDYTLGSGLLLAEKLGNTKDIRFLYRGGRKNFRPLISVCGPRYELYSQWGIISNAYEYIIRESGVVHCLPCVERWEVTDERTLVDIKLATWHPQYDFVITLQTGDIPGTSIATLLYAQFQHPSKSDDQFKSGDKEKSSNEKEKNSRVLIRKNSSYHWSSFKNNDGVEGLFLGIFQALSEFESAMNMLDNISVPLSNVSMDPVYNAIGKKRTSEIMESLQALNNGHYTASSLFKKIMEITYNDLPEKQAGDLAKAYGTIFNRLCGKDIIRFQIPASEKAEKQQESHNFIQIKKAG